MAELGGQERLHEVPGHAGPHRAATDADDVHVVVLDPLPGGKVIMDQRGTNTRHLVGADGGAHAAAADGHAALDRPRRHSLGERDDEVRIVVVWTQLVRPEIDDVVSRCAELSDQILFQAEPPVIADLFALAHGLVEAFPFLAAFGAMLAYLRSLK